jgi:hypothetical protein
MEYPWKFYEKSVGMWVIESNRSVFTFPLDTKELDIDSVSRGYFHYFDDVMLALQNFFAVKAVEYPPGTVVVESPIPLDLYQTKLRIFEAWREDVKHCDLWAPGAIFTGLTDVAVQTNDGKMVRAQLPDAVKMMFSGVPGSDQYALVLSTNCDIWLEKTISGKDNATGPVNAMKLKNALEKAANALDGKVVHYATEYVGVDINENGFGAK